MKKGIVFAALLMCSTSVLAMTPTMYSRVMTSVQSRNLQMLKDLVAGGVELNSPLYNGMTPLCETVMRGDYAGYEMLQTQGASPYVRCMKQLPQDRVAEFYANQPSANTYYTGHMASARSARDWGTPLVQEYAFPYLGVGEILLAGVAVGAGIALGHGGGSSGGGGGGDDDDKESKWAAPLNLNTTAWTDTAQYQSSNVDGNKGINFLGSINAASAYARGYTGYNINRQSDGTLIGEGSAAILANSPVKVGVVDTGVWINHTKLSQNAPTISTKTYNFVYGPCGTSTEGKCWKWIAKDPTSDANPSANDKGFYHLYADGDEVKQWPSTDPSAGQNATDSAVPILVNRGQWWVYQTRYNGILYNPNDPKPTQRYVWRLNAVTTYDYYKDDEGKEYVYYTDEDGNGHSYLVTCADGGSCTYTKGGTAITVTKEIDYDNHGTMVAGLIAAMKTDTDTSGMMGVAYHAEIIPIKADVETNDVLTHIQDAVDLKADIVNISYGTSAPLMHSDTPSGEGQANLISEFDNNMRARPDYANAYQAAAKATKDGQTLHEGTILVFAAGNYWRTDSGKPYDSNIYSMAPLSNYFNGTTVTDGVVYDLRNLVVNAVAVDSHNNLAAYSAKCGITKDYCVAAPGGDGNDLLIYSTAKVDGSVVDQYTGAYGTSLAAPIVSGALAVIKGAFPHLTNQQVVQILFETAQDLGEKGVDDIYGHGLIDLAAATNPVGLPLISLTSSTKGTSVSANSSTSSVSSTFANVASALPRNMIVLDKYERAFAVPTSSFVHVAKRENKLDGRFKSFMSGDEKVVAKTDTMRMSYSERHSRLYSQMPKGSVRFELSPTSKLQFKTYYSENTQTSGGTYFERLIASPYGKMKEAWGGSMGYNISKNWKASVEGQIGQNGFVDEKDLSRMDHNRMSLFQSSVQYTGFKKVGLKAVAGVANEQGSLFGMWGRGAFKTGNSKTTYVGAGVTLNLTDDVTLEGMYYSGTTKVNNSNSLLQMSTVKSDSFAMTAAWQMDENKTLGFHFVSPLRVKNGTAQVTLPVARDAYEDIVYQNTTRANLKPSAREYDLGFYFTDSLREDVQVKSEFGVRLNPDHVAGAAPDWRALIGMHWGL